MHRLLRVLTEVSQYAFSKNYIKHVLLSKSFSNLTHGITLPVWKLLFSFIEFRKLQYHNFYVEMT